MSCVLLQVEEYEVKYISLDVMSESEVRVLPFESEDDILVIDQFPGATDKGMRLEARIKYKDGLVSPWISSKEPVRKTMRYQYFSARLHQYMKPLHYSETMELAFL